MIIKGRRRKMAKLEDLGEVIFTDLLIVGGGIGGLVAAIKAKEKSPEVNVLIVDKQTIGWAGSAPKGGGMLWVLAPEDDLDEFVEYQVRIIGDYLNDQELLYSFARETYGAIEQLAEWGAKVTKETEGKLATYKWTCPKWSLVDVDLDMLFPLRAKARKLGAKILNKVQVVDLLKQGDRVVGGVGFNLIDGRFHIFKAKATILATSACSYKVGRMWTTLTGDGIAAAYRAGAEMRNAEFANFYDVLRKDTGSPVFRGDSFLLNAAGEDISKRYTPAGPVPDIAIETLLGMEKEINEGRGPIYLDLPQLEKEFSSVSRFQKGPHFLSFWGRAQSKELKYGSPPSPRPEVTLGLHGNIAPIKVDHEMKTSLAGLWAIGSARWAGSCWQGAVPPPGRMRGSGLMDALLSGLRGSPPAARFASKAASPEINEAEVKRLKEEIFAPMKRAKGLLPIDAIYAVQDVVVPVKYNLRRSKDRLEEGLSKIKAVQDRLPELYAKDGHGLGKCHEAKAMALCAEMTFRAALMRTESRGWHYREDYPERDDKNWLKWIIVKQEGGKMVLSTEPIPIEKYKFKPQGITL
jgi:succinate dehydrogenase/fumarate reductase flavoprotein subunit